MRSYSIDPGLTSCFRLQRIPWMRREGEYFCPIMCCWRSTEAVNTPLVSRINDPAAVVTAQRRRALLQPILQQVFAQRGPTNAVRISVGGTQYQVIVPNKTVVWFHNTLIPFDLYLQTLNLSCRLLQRLPALQVSFILYLRI